MNSLLNILLVNAITVLPLAAIAAFVAWRGRRAPLQHAVWVLVLLKFVTPPLWSLPVNFAVLPAPAVRDVAAWDSTSVNAGCPVGSVEQTPSPRVDSTSVGCETTPSTAAVTSPALSRASTIPSLTWPSWLSLILASWLTGSLCWLSVQIYRALRFETLITYRSRCPDELQSQCSQLAHQQGILRAPRVCVIDAAMSPMLWGFGRRAKLLFPAKLAARMNEESRATLLMHELAHYRRGDHFVRVLELLATGLFWWHPVLWIARRQIEHAEEECCDAWVVEQFPKSPRQYAEALLDTIDFLCESRRALPPLASGLGQAPFLRRRLTQIMQGTTIPPLTGSTRLALLLSAALLLPVQPFVLAAASLHRVTDRLPNSLLSPESMAADATANDIDSADEEPLTPTVLPEPTLTKPLERPNRTKSRPQRTRKTGEVWSTAVSSDGRFVIRIYTTRRVTLTDLQLGHMTELPTGSIAAVAFSPDGRWFVTAGQDGRVLRWDAARAEVESVLLEHDAKLNTVAVSPEGDRVAIGGRGGSVMVFDSHAVSSPQKIAAPAAVNCVRFSPNGRQLAIGCGDWMASTSGQVLLFDTQSGKIMQRKDSVVMGAIAFASDDELILGGWTGRVQLWNLASDEIVAEGNVDKNVVSAAAFSPDNPALREAVLLPSVSSSEPSSTFSFLREFLEQAP